MFYKNKVNRTNGDIIKEHPTAKNSVGVIANGNVRPTPDVTTRNDPSLFIQKGASLSSDFPTSVVIF